MFVVIALAIMSVLPFMAVKSVNDVMSVMADFMGRSNTGRVLVHKEPDMLVFPKFKQKS